MATRKELVFGSKEDTNGFTEVSLTMEDNGIKAVVCSEMPVAGGAGSKQKTENSKIFLREDYVSIHEVYLAVVQFISAQGRCGNGIPASEVREAFDERLVIKAMQ